MINYHPSPRVLEAFVAGELPVSVSVVVASHIEMCEQCRNKVTAITDSVADDFFNAGLPFDESADEYDAEDDLVAFLASGSMSEIPLDKDEMAMMESITSLPVEEQNNRPEIVKELELNGLRIALPRALKSIELTEWKGFGKISRSRLGLEDENRKTSLLHIDKGGSIPNHTHKGFEITLLLQGSFSDEMGHYEVGDFVWLDGAHTHSPVTEEGCICLTVSSDAICFTQGVSKLLNPIGRFIY
jgi:putative transcriptional regulator